MTYIWGEHDHGIFVSARLELPPDLTDAQYDVTKHLIDLHMEQYQIKLQGTVNKFLKEATDEQTS